MEATAVVVVVGGVWMGGGGEREGGVAYQLSMRGKQMSMELITPRRSLPPGSPSLIMFSAAKQRVMVSESGMLLVVVVEEEEEEEEEEEDVSTTVLDFRPGALMVTHCCSRLRVWKETEREEEVTV